MLFDLFVEHCKLICEQNILLKGELAASEEELAASEEEIATLKEELAASEEEIATLKKERHKVSSARFHAEQCDLARKESEKAAVEYQVKLAHCCRMIDELKTENAKLKTEIDELKIENL